MIFFFFCKTFFIVNGFMSPYANLSNSIFTKVYINIGNEEQFDVSKVRVDFTHQVSRV